MVKALDLYNGLRFYSLGETMIMPSPPHQKKKGRSLREEASHNIKGGLGRDTK